jgi:mRNA-degrading endonuclease toxin of MazEF toxin-antitoxin module
MWPMQAGDVLLVDFGSPARGEAGFIRPAVVLTSDDVLSYRQSAVLVAPCTTTVRGWLTEVKVEDFGVAQAHIVTTISTDRVVELTGVNVGPVVLRQIRELVGELLEL